MNFTATVTSADIRYYIDQAVSELEEDSQICFPDCDSRTEFIDECVASEIDKIELYDINPFGCYSADYRIDVLDMAEVYDYTV